MVQERFKKRVPVHFRHSEVKQNEVRFEGFKEFKGFSSIVTGGNSIPYYVEDVFKKGLGVDIVINDENMLACHLPTYLPLVLS